MARSRIESIFENMLGAEHPILEPMSRTESYLLQLKDLISHIGSIEPVTSDEIDEIIDAVQ